MHDTMNFLHAFALKGRAKIFEHGIWQSMCSRNDLWSVREWKQLAFEKIVFEYLWLICDFLENKISFLKMEVVVFAEAVRD